MAFLEERISVDVQNGFSYEDDFNVQITRTAGGNEYRRLIHPIPIRIFTVHYIADAPKIYTDIYNLYHRAFGRFAGFRAKVLDDFSTNVNTLTPTHVDQPLIMITPTTYQLVKQYGLGSPSLSIGFPIRTIYKPVVGTVKIGLDGVLQIGGYAVDYSTGIVTFSSTPVGVVTCGCEFDLPVRFDSAVSLRQELNWRDTSDIKLIELLNPGV